MSLIAQWVRRIQGLHPLIDADGSRAERKLVARTARDLEGAVGRRFKRKVRLTIRAHTGRRPSKTLRRDVGVVDYEGQAIVGLTQPGGGSCFVVTGIAGQIEHPMIQHELAVCLAMQHGLRRETKTHTPREWASKVWGWT